MICIVCGAPAGGFIAQVYGVKVLVCSDCTSRGAVTAGRAAVKVARKKWPKVVKALSSIATVSKRLRKDPS
jgi:hypothetical protein